MPRSAPCQLDRACEHIVEHRLGQTTREGVLLARVERAEQHRAPIHAVLDTVPESRSRPDVVVTAGGLEPERPQTDHHPTVTQERQFLGEEGSAPVALIDRGLVLRRGAPHGSGHPGTGQLETVIAAHRVGLARQSGPVHRGEQPVTAAVAGEDPPRPIRAVRRRGESEHHDARGRVTEPADGPSPIGLLPVGGSALPSDELAPVDQPGAGTARLDALGECVERCPLADARHTTGQ